MINNLHNNEEKKLTMPLNPIYAKTARNVATSIAEQMSFSNSKVEDIRLAVSETVSYLINKSDNKKTNSSNFEIKFKPNSKDLQVEFNADLNMINSQKESPMAFKLINNCMDNVSVNYNNDSSINILMTKKI